MGNLRFAAPVPPEGRNTTVNDGSVGAVCPQANPDWSAIAVEFSTAYVEGKPFDFNAAVAALLASNATAPPVDGRTTEDCLFLDVVVSKQIFEGGYKSRKRGQRSKGAPVIVWIYGGGYTLGDKTGSGNPAGLIEASQANGSPGVIYVSMNYRLGAFGWICGPTLQSNGTANAGLYDQRLALEWVQKYIHLFGGDPDCVTVFGESAGGGSIMHQITAYGGLLPVPFEQAVPQSPGWLPIPSNDRQENITLAYLALLNVSTIQEARQLPSAALIAANTAQIGLQASYGSYVYGPVVDGIFVPALPGKLLLQGNFAKNLKIMVGHNADEGVYFTDPRDLNDTALIATLVTNYPTIPVSAIEYITQVLYPPVFDGTYPYTSQIQRAILITSESVFTCNTNYLDRAYGDNTYSYQFSVPPALHGQDVAYTYYNGPNTAVLNATVAMDLQKYITSFAENGVPAESGIPSFPLYGSGSTILNLNATFIDTIMDPNANARCLWWQKALYY